MSAPKRVVVRRCPRCGKRARITQYVVQTGHNQGHWGGSSYCRRCQYAVVVEHQQRPSGILKTCDGCGVEYEPTKRAVYAHRPYQSPRPSVRWYCTLSCGRKNAARVAAERRAALSRPIV